jgi:hypothetical protein
MQDARPPPDPHSKGFAFRFVTEVQKTTGRVGHTTKFLPFLISRNNNIFESVHGSNKRRARIEETNQSKKGKK